jgi:glycine oxidase
MILDAVSAGIDDRAFGAVESAARRYALPAEQIEPQDVPGYRPLDNDRALRALHLPAEVLRRRPPLDGHPRPRAERPVQRHARGRGPLARRRPGLCVRIANDRAFTAPTAVVAAGVGPQD